MYDSQKNLLVEAYSDLVLTNNKNSNKLTFCFIFILIRGFVNLWSEKQAIIALSSIKAKYIASTLATKKVIWLYLLLIKLGFF